MTIKEWLTPGFFEINVVLVTLMMCWTIFAIASNFLVDFHMGPRVQAANYFGAVIMTLVFGVLLLVIDPIKTIYPNPYDFLLIGNGPVLGSIVAGVAGGAVLGWKLGGKPVLRISAAVAAVICEAMIGAAVLMWILSQE